VFAGLAGLIAVVLSRLGYVVTLWNSERVLSLRRRLTERAHG
jgi:hypothetical protein